MKRKLQHYRREIRRSEIQSYFSQVRRQLLGAPSSNVIDLQKPYQRTPHVDIEAEQPTRQSQHDVQNEWEQNISQLKQHLAQGDYQGMIPIIEETYHTLKKIAHYKSCLHSQRSHLFKLFLENGYLSEIVKTVLSANRSKIPAGLFQRLSRPSINLTRLLVVSEPASFTEQVFLAGDLLPFFRVCNDQPKHDSKHLLNIIQIIHQMLLASNVKGGGELFLCLNDPQHLFNMSFPFYSISRLEPEESSDLCKEFICLFREYYGILEEKRHMAKSIGQAGLKVEPMLNQELEELCFKIANRSTDYFLDQDHNEDEEVSLSLFQAVDLLRMLIERHGKDSGILHTVNYRRLAELLNERRCPEGLIETILPILDHVIYLDDGYIYELVAQGDLLSILWKLQEKSHHYVMNIFSNVTLCDKMRPHLKPYLHQIFLRFDYASQHNIYKYYNFLYNWFSTQQFYINDEKEKLLLQVMASRQPTTPAVKELDSILWVQLANKNEDQNLPPRILDMLDKNEREETL